MSGSSYGIITLRVLIMFAAIWVFTRIAGKRQFSKLTFLEYIIALIPVAIAGGVTSNEHLDIFKAVYTLLLWAVFSVLANVLEMRSHWARKLISGEPTVVIENGKLLEKNMSSIRYNVNNVLTQLREQGVFDLPEVEFAVIEPTGKMSILRKSQYQPVTPRDLKISTGYKGLPAQLILDGHVIEAGLVETGLSRAWLDDQLRVRGIQDERNVFLASLGTDGTLYVAQREQSRGASPAGRDPRGE